MRISQTFGNLCAAAFVMLLVGRAAGAVVITRGPYLQVGTPNSVVVRWRTDTPTDTAVRYGTDIGSLTLLASSPDAVTEHEIKVTGLAAATRYYYTIGTSSEPLITPDPGRYFKTSPPPGTVTPIHMWVTGDFGFPSTMQAVARDSFYAYNAGKHCDLWLWLGDNVYFTGEDSQYQTLLFNVYGTALAKWISWPTTGNHDMGLTSIPVDSRPYFLNFSMPMDGEAGGVASGNKHYFSFDYGNVHFISMDAHTEKRTTTGRMYQWLQSDLQANTQPWTIVYWHYPPYTRGSYDSDVDPVLKQMREVFVPLLETYGADLLLCGHSHSYERSCLLDGHYGAASTLTPAMMKDPGDGKEEGNGAYHKAVFAGRGHKGTVYVVNGACAFLGTNMPLNHPVMKSSLAVIGNMEIDVNGNRLDARYINTSGQIADHFTIIKDTELAVSSPGAARPQPDGVRVRLTSDVTVTLVDAPGAFYVQALDRSSGIRAETSALLPSVGAKGTISGTLVTLETGERALSGAVFTPSGNAAPRPLNLTSRLVGGQGCIGDTGNLTNRALLVRVTGRVLSVDPNAATLWLDDGSAVEPFGLKVTHVPASPQVGQMVSVVGVVAPQQSEQGLTRVICARDEGIAGDFVIHE